MRLILRVWDSADVQHYLDLYSDDPVSLTKQFTDIQDVNSPKGSFSQSFRIPATGTNAVVFDNFEDVNSQGDFNSKRKLKAEIESDTLPIMRGYIQFKACYIEKEFPEYEIVFFGEASNLFKEIGDSKLVDLDLSAFNHDLDYSNVTGSWAGSLFSGAIRYGMMDKGRNWSFDGTGNPINSTNPIRVGDWTPYIRIKDVVDTIFSDAGFTYTSTFLDAQTNAYTPLFNGLSLPVSATAISAQDFNVGITEEVTVTAAGFYQFTNLSDSGNFFDNGSDYTIGADDYWTAPFSGSFSFQGWINGDGEVLNNEHIRIKVTKNGVVEYLSDDIQIYGDATFSGSYTFGFSVTQGAEYRFGVQIYEGTQGSSDINFFGTSSPDVLAGCGWRIIGLAPPSEGFEVDIAGNCPDIKQKDYLIGLQKMFNLVFVPDNNNPLNIIIEPFEEYIGTGDTLDWTNLIDYGKTVKIEPTSDIQKREYEWTFTEDKDVVNQFYKENADRIYGRYKIDDTENDFSTDKLQIKTPFGAYPCAYINETSIVIHKSVDDNGQIIKEPKCKVVLWGGLQDCIPLVARNNDTDANVTITQYPYLGHYSIPEAGVGETDFNYGSETPLHVINGNPNDNLYNVYWRTFVNSLYSSESRKMTAFFDLDVVDYYNLKFSDLVYIKDAYWRILKINGFQPNTDDLTQIELIKILDTPRACEFIPTSITTGGLVQFLDADGVTSGGSQACCEFWGYVWNVGLSRCYVNQSGGTINRIATSPDSNLNSTTRTLSFGRNVNGIGSNNGLLTGQDNNTGNENFFSVMSGRGNTAEDAIGVNQAFGEDVNAWVRGLHSGNGMIAKNGDAQSGIVHLTFAGTMDGTVVLEPFLTIPNNSTISLFMNFCLSEWSTSTSRVISDHYLSASTSIHRDTAGAGSITPVTVSDVGSVGTGVYTATIDTSTDTTQHRIQLVKSGAALSNAVKVVCSIRYVMTRH